MKSALVFIVIAAVSMSLAAATPFNNMTGLARQAPLDASNPRVFKHSFDHTDWRGRKTQLHYHTEVSEKVVRVEDLAPGLTFVACKADSVEFEATVSDASSLSLPSIGSFLSGNHTVGCVSAAGAATSLQRKVTGVTVNGKSVVFATTQAGIHELLKTAKVNFKTNAFQPNTTAPPSTTPNRRGFMSWLGSAVSSAASDVVNSVGGVAAAAEDLVTGDVDTSTNLLGNNGDFSYNYNPSTGAASQVFDLVQLSGGDASLSVQCSNCYATLSTDLEFSIDISDYTLQSMSIVASANANLNVEVTMNAQYANSWSGSASIATVTGPTIPFDIGIPVTIAVSFPLSGGYQVSLDAQASADVVFTANGAVSYGASYTADNGWGPVQSQSFNWNSNVNSVTGTANGNAGVYLTPGISLAADGCLDAGLTLIPFVSSSLTYNLNGIPSEPSYDVEAAANYGLNAQFNAGINIGGMDQVSSWQSPVYNLINNPFGSSPYFFDQTSSRRSADKTEDEAVANIRRDEQSQLLAGQIPQVLRDQMSSSSSAAASPAMTCNAALTCNGGTGMVDCATNTCVCLDGWTGPTCAVPPPRIAIPANMTRSKSRNPERDHKLISVAPERSSLLAAGFCPSGSCAPLKAEDVTTCSHLVGQAVCNPISQDIKALDASIAEELAQVGSVGPRCIAAMRHQLCALRFPLCTPSTARISPMCFNDCVTGYEACDMSSSDANSLCLGASGARNGSSVAPPPMDANQVEICAAARSGDAGGLTRTCVVATDLKFCNHLNNKKIALTPLAFATPAAADSHVGAMMAKATFASDSCRAAALTYRCAQFLPVCGGKNGDDANWPQLLLRDTCLTMLSGCELPSIADRACNSSSARWVNDTVAPAFVAQKFAFNETETPTFMLAQQQRDLANNESAKPWLIPVAVVGAAVVGAVVIGVAVKVMRSRRARSVEGVEVELKIQE